MTLYPSLHPTQPKAALDQQAALVKAITAHTQAMYALADAMMQHTAALDRSR